MKNKELLSRIESKIGVSEGTAIFILSTLIIKIMGAVYKIPLCNLLGSKGVGLYQMVFPVYSLCITIACGGLPTAMTQIIAKGYNAENLLKKCLKSFLAIAIVLSLAIVVFSNKIALAQGDNSARLLYFAIAPAILFVSVICCFRGYFQGKGNFKPTAFSQMIEQVVKCVFGVIALLLVKRNIIIRTLFACFAITFSEIIALVYLALKYKKYRKKTLENNLNTKISFKQLFIIIAPITFALLFFPLASFIDSFIVVNALKNSYFERATEVYGIYAGGVETIIALPVALLHNLSLGYLPTLTKNNGGIKALAFTFILSVVCGNSFFSICREVVFWWNKRVFRFINNFTSICKYKRNSVINLAGNELLFGCNF